MYTLSVCQIEVLYTSDRLDFDVCYLFDGHAPSRLASIERRNFGKGWSNATTVLR